jgi:hypothetical protein
VYYGVIECDELNLGLFKMPAKYHCAVNVYFSMLNISIYLDLFDFTYP